MILRNTSRYPTEEIRRLVLFGFSIAKASHERVAVHVKNSFRGAYGGMAYRAIPAMSSAAEGAERLVTLRIGGPSTFPQDNMVTTLSWSRWLTREEMDALKKSEPHPEEKCAWSIRSDDKIKRGVPVRHPYGGRSSPMYVVNDWREALVAVSAHEARHLFQFRGNRPASEVECERFAAKALTEYRTIRVNA